MPPEVVPAGGPANPWTVLVPPVITIWVSWSVMSAPTVFVPPDQVIVACALVNGKHVAPMQAATKPRGRRRLQMTSHSCVLVITGMKRLPAKTPASPIFYRKIEKICPDKDTGI